jgi:hypothetical protein
MENIGSISSTVRQSVCLSVCLTVCQREIVTCVKIKLQFYCLYFIKVHLYPPGVDEIQLTLYSSLVVLKGGYAIKMDERKYDWWLK